MPRTSLHVLATDREVLHAKPRGNRAEYRIKGAPGLVLRISAAGTKSWTFRYKSPSSHQQCKLALGSYPALRLSEARDRAQRLAIDVRDGRDPLAQKRADQSADTFAALAARYMAGRRHKNARFGRRSGWPNEVQRLLDRDILPAIGQHKADAITRQQVADLVDAVAQRGSHSIADKVLGVVRAIYRWAAETGRTDVDPTWGMKKRNMGRPRDRVLTDPELRSFWRGLDASTMSAEIRDILRLQVLLGLRVGEAAGAAQGEIDLANGVWVIPANRTKSKREHRLPLPPLAADILRSALKRANDSPWLFPSNETDGPTKPKSAMRAILRFRKKQARSNICVTFASWYQQKGDLDRLPSPKEIAEWLRSVSTSDRARISRADVKEHLAAVLADQRAKANRINPAHPAIAAAVRAAPERRSKVGSDRPGYSTHDLRRTVATGLGNLGKPDEVIERVLNHAPRTVTGRHYNHAKYFEPMREALEAWERRVRSIVEGNEPPSIPESIPETAKMVGG